MFIYETHLPQILSRESYTSDFQHSREIDRLFEPSWHFIATAGDVRRDGDFVTTTLFDHPLIIWNSGGKIQTFLNTCPQGCRLTSRGKGNTKHFACRQHGLEFGAVQNGNARASTAPKVPRLTRVRTEFCGPLIFVNFAEHAPDLETFIGPMWETMQSVFPNDIRDVLLLDYEIEANWKIKVENTLESYHVEMVHPKTFSHMPDAEVCREELGFNYSSFHAVEEAPTKINRVLDRCVHKIAGAELDLIYSHYIVYPHVMFAKMRLLSWIETVYPISASRHRVVLRSFYRPTNAGAFRSGLGYQLLRTWGRIFGRTVSGEDAAIIPGVQKGLASPTAPSGGLLSIREERLFHFQEYIQRQTEISPP